MIRIIIFFFFLLTLNAIPALAQDNSSLVNLKIEIANMSSDPLFKYGQIGFSFRTGEGKVIYEHNGDKSLIPASNLKLLTTASALKVLGEEYKFETRLTYDGVLKDGVLNGNIYIEGGGDPTLGSDRIEGYPDLNQLLLLWTEKIKQTKITQIKGSIIAELPKGFNNNPIPDGWIWSDIGNYYGAGASGLNINENLYKLVFKPGNVVGDSTTVLRTEPAIPDLQFENKVKTGQIGSGDNAYIYGAPFSNYRYLSGTIPAGVPEFTIKGSVPDPALLTAVLLHKTLNDGGITIGQEPKKALGNIEDKKRRMSIYTHSSPSVKEMVRYTNFYSINLYAEALLIKMAAHKGLDGTTENGIQVMAEYWKKRGLDVQGMTLRDGSGLSPQTAIRPSQMTSMLNLMTSDTSFFSSLPVAGESGTLKKICNDTPAKGKVFAKSGTLSKVICYSGYVRSQSGKLNSFSIFINNYTGTNSAVLARISTLMVLLTKFD